MSPRTPLSLAAVLALGLAAAPAHAATPATADARIVLAPSAAGQDAPASQRTYYLQRVAGTNKIRRVYIFERLDANHDGELSRSEVPRDMHDLRAHFIEADWSGNGRLSPDEYRMYHTHTAPLYTAISHAMIFMGGPSRVNTDSVAGL